MGIFLTNQVILLNFSHAGKMGIKGRIWLPSELLRMISKPSDERTDTLTIAIPDLIAELDRGNILSEFMIIMDFY